MKIAKLHIDKEFIFRSVVVSHLPDDCDTLSEEKKAKVKRSAKDSKDL